MKKVIILIIIVTIILSGCSRDEQPFDVILLDDVLVFDTTPDTFINLWNRRINDRAVLRLPAYGDGVIVFEKGLSVRYNSHGGKLMGAVFEWDINEYTESERVTVDYILYNVTLIFSPRHGETENFLELYSQPRADVFADIFTDDLHDIFYHLSIDGDQRRLEFYAHMFPTFNVILLDDIAMFDRTPRYFINSWNRLIEGDYVLRLPDYSGESVVMEYGLSVQYNVHGGNLVGVVFEWDISEYTKRESATVNHILYRITQILRSRDVNNIYLDEYAHLDSESVFRSRNVDDENNIAYDLQVDGHQRRFEFYAYIPQ